MVPLQQAKVCALKQRLHDIRVRTGLVVPCVVVSSTPVAECAVDMEAARQRCNDGDLDAMQDLMMGVAVKSVGDVCTETEKRRLRDMFSRHVTNA